MLNSVAAGRRLAWRAVAWQVAAVLLVGLVFLVQGPIAALAALAGGGGVVLGGLAAMLLALGGGIGPAGVAFARLLTGLVLKWVVVFVVLLLGLVVWKLPALALLAGLLAGLIAQALAIAINR